MRPDSGSPAREHESSSAAAAPCRHPAPDAPQPPHSSLLLRPGCRGSAPLRSSRPQESCHLLSHSVSDTTFNLHCTRQSHQRKLQGRDWIPWLRRSVLLSLVPSHSALCPAVPRRLLASAWGSRSLETRVSERAPPVGSAAPRSPGLKASFLPLALRLSGKCPGPDPLCSSHSSSPFKPREVCLLLPSGTPDRRKDTQFLK